MGARPLAAFLSLALPTEMLSTRAGRVWVERFFAGLRSLADRHAVPLAGGDTAESPSDLVLADIVLIGSAPAGRALRRSGARAGDALYVTGELGGAAAELAAMDRRAATNPAHPYKDLGAPSIPRSLRNGWESTPNQLAAHPHLFPQPRTAVGLALLRRRLATACIDLSDGLSTDLAHLCRESGVGARISSAALPIHPLAQQTRAAQSGQAHAATNRALDLALHGGEDYELLFAAPPSVRLPRRLAGVRVTRIGSLVRGRSISLLDPTGRRTPLQPGGWEHFTGKHED
jgi:thiamine-monophosphate kinase